MAIKYARRINKRALASKLESIAEMKEKKKEDKNIENCQDSFTINDDSNNIHEEEVDDVLSVTAKQLDVEIKPLAITVKRVNPFLKSESSSPSARGKCCYDN